MATDPALQGNIDRVVRRSDLPSTYLDTSEQLKLFPQIGQGPSRIASDEDLARDELGFTAPNLHRRVDPQAPKIADDIRNQEVAPRSYQLGIQNVHSYRTTNIHVHDENSVDSEIP